MWAILRGNSKDVTEDRHLFPTWSFRISLPRHTSPLLSWGRVRASTGSSRGRGRQSPFWTAGGGLGLTPWRPGPRPQAPGTAAGAPVDGTSTWQRPFFCCFGWSLSVFVRQLDQEKYCVGSLKNHCASAVDHQAFLKTLCTTASLHNEISIKILLLHQVHV